MSCRLVIFDFDGTLADSGDWFLSVVNQIARRYGFREIDDGEVEMLRGRGTRDVIAYLGIPRWKLPFIARHLRLLVAQHAERIPLFSGVADMLETLSRNGVRLALVTSNSEANARRILGSENSARFGWIEGGSSLFGKPAKFRRVLHSSGVPAAHAIAIGDEMRDLEAARLLGLRFGAVTWGYANYEAMRACAPDALFRTREEIVPFVLG